jgi:hypothetical protein
MRRVARLHPNKKRKSRFVAASADSMHRSISMMDIFMSALALAFFAAAIGYAYACEHL